MKCLIFVAKTTGFECLRWLLAEYPADDYTIFISEPDRDLIASWLDERSIRYYDLQDNPVDITANQTYEWLINIWGAYIFRNELLSRVKHSMNLHPSFLPFGRGRDPVVWAIQDDVSAGATLHEITEGVDAGPIWAQVEIPYVFPIAGQDLYAQVETACVKLFRDTWPDLRAGKLTAVQQGLPDLPTRKRKDLLADRVLDMRDPGTAQVIRRLMSHDFSGKGYSALLKSGDKTYTITLNIKPEESL